jgi:hypothetical protein
MGLTEPGLDWLAFRGTLPISDKKSGIVIIFNNLSSKFRAAKGLFIPERQINFALRYRSGPLL